MPPLAERRQVFNMKFSKHLIYFLFGLVGLLGFSVSVVFAQANYESKYGLKQTQNATCEDGDCALPATVGGANSAESLVGSVVNMILSVLGIVFFFIIFYAGFNWMTARGNGEKIEKSKEMIESAAIGLIIVLAAYAITNFIFSSIATEATTGKIIIDSIFA